jgi:hypothetical protein
LFLNSGKYDGSWIPEPDFDFFTHPASRGQKEPDPDPQHCIKIISWIVLFSEEGGEPAEELDILVTGGIDDMVKVWTYK